MGGSYASHLASHAFLDRTKDAYAQVPHRYLLHSSDFGAFCLRMAIPDGPDAARLVGHHLRDDFGDDGIHMARWLAEMRPELLPSARSGPLSGLDCEARATRIAEKMGLPDAALTTTVCRFMASADVLSPDADPHVRRAAIRNSFGIGLAEACLGVLHEVGLGSNRVTVGVREIAEADVMGEFGTIPPYAAVARATKMRPWMVGNGSDGR